MTERLARRAQKEIGIALYRACLLRLLPEVRFIRAEIDAEVEGFPDLLARSAEVLRAVLGEALGELPGWARPLRFADYFGIRHQRFRDQFEAMLADEGDKVVVNRKAGELAVSFGSDTSQVVSRDNQGENSASIR